MKTRNRLSLFALALIALVFSSACGGCSDEESNNGSDLETVIIDANITEDRTLPDIFVDDPEIPDYIVTAPNLEVRARLTVEPGVRIEFDPGTGFDVSTGSITAVGTAEKPIVFTSPDELPGSWMGLSIKSSAATNELTHVIVSYGGQDAYAGINQEVNVGLGSSAKLKLTNSTLSHSAGVGLGTLLSADLDGFSTNTFVDNEGHPVALEANAVHFLDDASSYSGNGTDAILVTGATLGSDATWAGTDVPFRLAPSTIFEVRAALTIAAGATIEVSSGSHFSVSVGSLKAVGTADAPVTFTGVTKSPGAWSSIVFASSDPNNELTHCVIEFGGGEIVAGVAEATAVGLSPTARLTMTNSTVRDSAGWGVFLSADAVFTDDGNTYENNASGDVGPST